MNIKSCESSSHCTNRTKNNVFSAAKDTHLARCRPAQFAIRLDHDVHRRIISATRSANAAMYLPHESAETRGATLHLTCASHQPVASGQSGRARLTPRLTDAKPQSERQTDTHTRTDGQTDRQTAGNIRRNIITAAYCGVKCAWGGTRGEFEGVRRYLPKRRGEGSFDSGPDFQTKSVRNKVKLYFCPEQHASTE